MSQSEGGGGEGREERRFEMRIAVSCLTGVVAVLFLAARWFPSGALLRPRVVT